MLNYGTTFTGAFDEIGACCYRILPIFKKYKLDKVTRIVEDPSDNSKIKDVRTGYWIHVDGAYGGSFLPYVKKYYKKGEEDKVVDVVLD